MLRSGGIIPLHRRGRATSSKFATLTTGCDQDRNFLIRSYAETGAGCVSGEAPEIAALLQLTHSACALSGAGYSDDRSSCL
jgi:hypothetical protein